MTLILWIFLTFFIFFVAIMIHEFGHFITARWTGMRVLEFGFGIPPKIKKIFTDKQGTDYTINALPFGGFVRIDGEDVSSKTAFDEGNFMSKNWGQRILVLVAGVVMNFFLAWIIFIGLFLSGTAPLSPVPFDIGKTNSYFLPSLEEALESGYVHSDGVILRPLENSVAEKSWIQSWDVVTALNGEKLTSSSKLIEIIEKNEVFHLEILRNNENISLEITPENGKIGSYISDALVKNPDFAQNKSVSESISLASKEVYYSSALTFTLVKQVLQKLFLPSSPDEREEAKNSLSGPVGAGNAVVAMVEHKVPISILFIFTALLSINLAVMNLLPFPALDGGRMLFTTIYSLGATLGISKQKLLIIESKIHIFGFLLLIIFMIYVFGLDIMRIFGK